MSHISVINRLDPVIKLPYLNGTGNTLIGVGCKPSTCKFSCMKKRKFLAWTAVTAALCLTAFTLHTPSATASYYWFPLDPSSGFPQSTSHLVYQAADPGDCGNFPLNPYCNAAYTSYTGSGPYFASGVVVIVDYARLDRKK